MYTLNTIQLSDTNGPIYITNIYIVIVIYVYT